MLDCDNPFWKFSLAVYAAPEVASECLRLQRALNIDVNSLLFCAWLGYAKKVILTEKNLRAIDARVRSWHETVVLPLRAVRQDVKARPEMEHDAVQQLRKGIAGVELRAEQIEQAMLFESAGHLSDGCETNTIEEAVRRNVTALLQRTAINSIPPISVSPSAAMLIAAAIAYRP